MLASGEYLRLGAEVVWSDVAAFEEALEAGEEETATEHYGGPFLEGFYLSGCREFETWIESERRRLATSYERAVEALAERAEDAGDHRRAVDWWWRLVIVDPYNTRIALRLMQALAAAGDRANAIQFAQEHERLLKKELGIEPDAELLALVERLRSEPEPAGVIDHQGALADDSGADVPAPGALSPGSRLRRPRSWRWAIALPALVLAVALARALWFSDVGTEAEVLDPEVVAVVPFRVTGSASEADFLGEGMVDLLAAKLTGEVGPRAVDPRTALSAWRRMTEESGDLSFDRTLAVARQLQAGQLLHGAVVSAPDRLVLSASLLLVRSGEERARITVEGPADSLLSLIDQLTVELLGLDAGEDRQRLSVLTSASLPAVRAYLAGQSAQRRGRYLEAVHHFDRALQLDSTFALAGLYVVDAVGWAGASGEYSQRGVRAAWAQRDRLSERDRTQLLVYTGSGYPDEVYRYSTESLEHRSRLIELAPDRPEAWYIYGDQLFHAGDYLGQATPGERAAAAFRRAIELDPMFAGPLQHLLELAAVEGDTAAVRLYGARFLEMKREAEFADYVRWRMWTAVGDTAALDSLRLRFDELNATSLHMIIQMSQFDGVGLQDAERAVPLLVPASHGEREHLNSLNLLRVYALNRGRPEEATRLGEALAGVAGAGSEYYRHPIYDALYWDGDTAVARRAAEELEAYADRPLAQDSATRWNQRHAICAVTQWRLWRGEIESAPGAIERLRSFSAGEDPPYLVFRAQVCAAILAAILESVSASVEDEHPALDSLDTLMKRAPRSPPEAYYANLVVARLRRWYGEYADALAASRRYTYQSLPRFLSSYLLEEAKAAALAGDREAAIRAYRHYLVLRPDPEPSLLPQVQGVRAELTALLRRG